MLRLVSRFVGQQLQGDDPVLLLTHPGSFMRKAVVMDELQVLSRRLSRRTVLGIAASAGATFLLAACATDDDDVMDDGDAAAEPDDDDLEEEPEPEEDEEVDEPDVDEEPDEEDDEAEDEVEEDEVEEDEEDDEHEEDDEEEEPAVADEEAEVIVDDVIDFTLAPDGRWDGPFGSVTMQLHRGWVDGEELTFIRTDASDEDFASNEGLVFVPLMANALDEPDSHAELYLFENGHDDQLPVMSVSPADGENFSPAFRVHYIRNAGALEEPLTSEQEILDAVDAGDVEHEETDIIVNYPVITWPGGQIPVDEEKVEALGGGQLIEEPDIDGGQVTLKLHQCYPGSRYIITDTSALPMAPMMGAGEAGASQLLIDGQAVAPITIFLNGLEGTGAMGFQPGVFNANAGDLAWSPFWEHFAVEWENEDEAVAVTSQRQLDELVDEGQLIRYAGVPDTDPDSFVVNCSVPILAPVTWEPPED
jgi:hypothetical protein